MHKRMMSLKSAVLQLILMSALAFLMPSVSVWGDCEQLYPKSDVTTDLSKTEYQNCTLGVMVQNYANLLQEKHRLLTDLKPAYSSKLDKEVVNEELTKEEATVRLKDYDTKLSALSMKKKSLASWVSTINEDTGTEEVNEISQEKKNELSEQLKKCKQISQALKRKLKWAKGEVPNAENDKFCKLDFYFRRSEGLNPMINLCLNPVN